MESAKPPISLNELMKKNKGIVISNTELIIVPTTSFEDASMAISSHPTKGSTMGASMASSSRPTKGSTMKPPQDAANSFELALKRETRGKNGAIQRDKEAAKKSGERKTHLVSIILSRSD